MTEVHQGKQKSTVDHYAGLLLGRMDALRHHCPDEHIRGFREAANAIPTVIWTANSQGEVTFFNQAYYTFTGVDHMDYASLLHPEDRMSSMVTWRRSIAERREHVGSARVRSADGRYHEMRTLARPVFDEFDGVRCWVGATNILTAEAALLIRVA